MELEEKLKQLIIDTLNLEGMTPADIPTEAALAVKNTFGVTLSAENEEMRAHFYSVQTLADFIRSMQ